MARKYAYSTGPRQDARRMPSLDDVADELRAAAEDHADAMAELRAMRRRSPYSPVSVPSALGALYSDDAPGAVLDGKTTWADLARAAVSPQGPEGKRLARLQNAMSERVPSAGGFTVPEILRSDMVLASLESAIIRPGATVVPASSLRTPLPMIDDTSHTSGAVLGGLSWTWAAEGSTLAVSTPSLGRDVLEARKLAAYLGSVPNELLDDGPAMEVFLRDVVPLGLAWAEDQAFIAGTGVAQPQGVLNAPCAINVTRTSAPASLQADVTNMITRMLPASLHRFIWLASPDKLGPLLNMYTLIGTIPTSAATAPSAWLQGNPQDGWTLLGRPIFFTEHVPAAGTRGDLIAVDPHFYVIADRQEMVIDVASRGQGFIQNASELRILTRLDGRIWLQSPLTPQNSSATVSPVVILN